jgi:hypothetical protein
MFGKLAVVVFTIASLALGTAALASATSHAQPDENNGLITVNFPYCEENPWDRATCPEGTLGESPAKDDTPPAHAGHKAMMMQAPRQKHS